MKVYGCKHCKNRIFYLHKAACNVRCCGEEMVELDPNTKDAAQEKHVPVIEQSGNLVTVRIGAVAHPMLEEHYIEAIAIETDQGIQRKALKPGDEPKAVFALVEGETLLAAYEYCNLHGLWKADA